MPWTYAFDHPHQRPPGELRDLLGGEGAELAELASVVGLPVPPGFTITTAASRARSAASWPEDLDRELDRACDELERRTGRSLGGPSRPLLLSVRPSAPIAMPGMADTVLAVGLNDRTVGRIEGEAGDAAFAHRWHARFMVSYGRVVMGVPEEVFGARLEHARSEAGVAYERMLDASWWRTLCHDLRGLILSTTGRELPQDPRDQLRGAVDALLRSWDGERAAVHRRREDIDEGPGTAINVQVMVFGDRGGRSCTGVASSRNGSTGQNAPVGEVLLNAEGEDRVAGLRAPDQLEVFADLSPDLHAALLSTLHQAEAHRRDMVDIEFTVEEGELWVLRVRVGRRTASAAMRMAVEMTGDQHLRLSRSEAIRRIAPEQVEEVLHRRFADQSHEAVATGLGASPGAAVGVAVFSAEEAVRRTAQGIDVILVREEMYPEDVHGMMAAQGLLTTRGGSVSHAAVVARGWRKPAVVGADGLHVFDRSFAVGAVTVREGDAISIDGTSGRIVVGRVPLIEPEPTAELDEILSWADEVRGGRLAVRANVETGTEAVMARRMGAEGVGLCRTEHMFLSADRLPVLRRAILADNALDEIAALDELRCMQRDDLVEVLEAMDGLPVVIRLLDAPLHEFLPRDVSTEWAEVNPMLGIRGVRLAVLKPGLYRMQLRAILEAVEDRNVAGGRPRAEVMVPFTASLEEMTLMRSWAATVAEDLGFMGPMPIGTMIETPRAALIADRLATAADFVSFGTNDLTQMTFGFSRDDVETSLIPSYLDQQLLPSDPFASLDLEGVAELLRIAIGRAREVNKEIPIGVCGEHGGDPASIAFFGSVGVDHLSCSPQRVPIARLAAAHACLAT